MDKQAFLDILSERLPDLDPEKRELLGRYRDLVVQGNTQQNLTRILAPADFFESNVLDAVELLKSGFVEYPALDLGSGAGMPGIPAAILGGGSWFLSDSEQSKAQFLRETVENLGLKGVETLVGRAEEALKHRTVGSVVARAVGPVERIHNWIRGCSTWNTLVLLKGPAWEDEWAAFQQSPRRKDLRIDGIHRYEVGAEAKKRVIVRLARSR